MTDSKMSRVPILVNDEALYVIHEPDVHMYAQLQSKKLAALPDTDVVGNLLSTEELQRAVTLVAHRLGPALS